MVIAQQSTQRNFVHSRRVKMTHTNTRTNREMLTWKPRGHLQCMRVAYTQKGTLQSVVLTETILAPRGETHVRSVAPVLCQERSPSDYRHRSCSSLDSPNCLTDKSSSHVGIPPYPSTSAHTTDTQEKIPRYPIASMVRYTYTHMHPQKYPAVHLFFPLSHPSPPTFMEKEFQNAWVFGRGGLSSAQSLRSVR